MQITNKIQCVIKQNENIVLLLAVSTGILLRLLLMTFGSNFDFESYCVVGKLMYDGENIYANTGRYNYGPIFSYIQGLCYYLSMLSQEQPLTYRVLLVSVLTVGDIIITIYLYKKYSLSIAIIFFLNPISIFITGYHNQFDNLAVLFALLSTLFFNKEKNINYKDIWFVIFMSLCLTTKHLFFVFPFWILIDKGLPLVKRILYSCVPPILFIISFVPYAIGNTKALEGIINNVFLYRSYNNAPLLHSVYEMLGVSEDKYLYIFVLIMCLLGWCFRKEEYEYRVLMYLLALVSFSSAVANQYLVIPMVALCVLSKNLKYIYMFIMTMYLLDPRKKMLNAVEPAYFWACLMLFVVIIKEIILHRIPKQKHRWITYI